MLHSIWKYNSLLLFTVIILAIVSCRKGGEPIPKSQVEESASELINDDVVLPVFNKTDGATIPKDPDEDGDGDGTVIGGDDGEDDDGGGIFDDTPPVLGGGLPKKVSGSQG